MMTSVLRVLLVEDSDDDATLIARVLRQGYPELRFARVQDAAALRAALAAEPWDVVLSDWTMPGFSGAEAFELVQETGLDLPFIIVSGSIGEEQAVEAMRAGVRDYVLKDRLPRLVSAVEREVQERAVRAEQKRRREEHVEALQRSRDELESRVQERTEQLGVANEQLRVANEQLARELVERQRAEEAAIRAQAAAEAANRAKSTFLANLSHEIRTPMNAVLGYTQLLQRDGHLSPKHQQHLEVISRSGDHLLSLINDVLEISKIEAGHRKVNDGDVDLLRLLDDLTQMVRLRADVKCLIFTIHRAPEVPRHIICDERKLWQILVNLTGNAVKFTERGSVTLRLEAGPAEVGALRLRVEVEDTGPGIASDEIASLFQPFGQTRVGMRTSGGTGLGLALSRELARIMGGDITVESVFGRGSVFRLDVPISIGRAPVHAPPAPESGMVIGLAAGAGIVRLLVVDDEKDNRGWLRQLLEEVGFEVEVAANGVEALLAFEQWRPQLVLMDMNMPVMDGYAATRAIRARETNSDTPIVATTASAFDDSRDAIFAAGATGWLRKPCRAAELLEEIQRHLGVEYRYAAPRPARSISGSQIPMLTPGLGLPPDLRARMRQAAHIADYGRLLGLLEEVPEELGGAEEVVRGLVERYDYESLVKLL